MCDCIASESILFQTLQKFEVVEVSNTLNINLLLLYCIR